MSWLTDRFSEPSTHAGIAVVGSQVLPLILPALGVPAELVSWLTAGISVFFGTTAAVKSDLKS